MFDSFRDRMSYQGGAMGKALKSNADMIMDATFTRDIAYRKCYIQDKDFIFPEQTLEGYRQAKSVYSGKTHYNPEKLKGFRPIDCKYLVNHYYAIVGDSIDYYLQFRPNVHGMNENIRIGALVFIPDDLGIYNLWMIVARDDRPQFPQFYVLRCDFIAKWHISEEDTVRYEGIHVDTGTYFSWCVARIQSSYNSGVWTDYLTTSVENQKKLWLPVNQDTQTIVYNEHITISTNPYRRTAWEITKVIDTEPAGLLKLTLAQQLELGSRDDLTWVNITSDEISDELHGAHYDFYQSRINDKPQHTPTDPFEVDESMISFTGVKPNLKVGGSYKTYTANFYKNGEFVEKIPYWTISYIVNDVEMCVFDFIYDENTIVPEVNSADFIVSKDRKIIYMQGKDEIFSIQYSYSSDSPNNLKLRCLSNLNMVGNKLIISATDGGLFTATIEVEVDGL